MTTLDPEYRKILEGITHDAMEAGASLTRAQIAHIIDHHGGNPAFCLDIIRRYLLAPRRFPQPGERPEAEQRPC